MPTFFLLWKSYWVSFWDLIRPYSSPIIQSPIYSIAPRILQVPFFWLQMAHGSCNDWRTELIQCQCLTNFIFESSCVFIYCVRKVKDLNKLHAFKLSYKMCIQSGKFDVKNEYFVFIFTFWVFFLFCLLVPLPSGKTHCKSTQPLLCEESMEKLWTIIIAQVMLEILALKIPNGNF